MTEKAIAYTDVEALKEVLVGRSIVAVESTGQELTRVLSYRLDDGTVLKAHATDGGCACSNGCFTVEPGATPLKGTIMNVEVGEFEQNWGSTAGEGEAYEPGSRSDGSALIRIFVYTELGGDRETLVESEGGDNGYYGWGFNLTVESPSAVLR